MTVGYNAFAQMPAAAQMSYRASAPSYSYGAPRQVSYNPSPGFSLANYGATGNGDSFSYNNTGQAQFGGPGGIALGCCCLAPAMPIVGAFLPF